MCIPPPQYRRGCARYLPACGCSEELNASGHKLDTLSMGMSADFRSAIAEGATLVRIGTAPRGRRARTNMEKGDEQHT
jgi:uncharacterized pyridoxal phosphate-containing UPF0001 family protein